MDKCTRYPEKSIRQYYNLVDETQKKRAEGGETYGS